MHLKSLAILPVLTFVGATFISPSALAERTALQIAPDAPDTAYTAKYSQGIALRARLSGELGPLAGERVTFLLAPEESDEAGFVIDDPLTDAQGVATARLTLVNGRYGGQAFEGAEPDGRAYRITARFAGDVDVDDPHCSASADAGVTDAADPGACDAEDTHPLLVRLEIADIAIQPGNQVALGESLTLIAVLTDPNGNAPQAGTDLDGSGPAPVPNGEVTFFFDLDRDERPALDERIGTGTSNGDGIATFNFTANPDVFPAGNFESGLMVQYGGDERFALAGAAARIVIEPGAPDPDNTLIEAYLDEELVEEAPADGETRLVVRATLVDASQNPLGIDAVDHDVSFETTLGTFEDEPVRDLLTGFYEQTLRAPDNDGSATITVNVDGVPGATETIVFTAQGCQCDSSAPTPGPTALGFLLLGFFTFLRRSRS